MAKIPRRILQAQFPVIVISLQILFIVLFWFYVDYSETGETSDIHVLRDSSSSVAIQNKVNLLGTKFAANAQKYPLFQDVHVMIFFGFGLLMTFLRHYSFSAVSLNLFIASLVIQWSMLLRAFIGNHGGKRYVDIKKMILMDFDCATVLISFGAVLGKVSPVQLVVMALCEVPLVIANILLAEETFVIADIGGSMLLHTFGAYFGLAVSAVLTRKDSRNNPNNESSYTSDIFSMCATVFLWCFWPSFNSALAGEDFAERAIINTYISLTASTLVVGALSTLNSPRGKFKIVHIQNATLAGGVVVGATANFMLHPSGALMTGVIAGIVSMFGFSFLQGKLEKIGLHDTCGVHNLHGMPGVAAGICSIVGAAVATEKAYGTGLYTLFPKMAPTSPGLLINTLQGPQRVTGDGRSAAKQALFQLATLGCTLGIAIGGGIITGIIMRLPIWDNIPTDELFMDQHNFEVPEEKDDKDCNITKAEYISKF